ncbi:MAG: hypothetical protein RLZZ262_784, partial [Bacteroidota bacterium]
KHGLIDFLANLKRAIIHCNGNLSRERQAGNEKA